MPAPSDILDEGVTSLQEYLGPWVSTTGLALVVISSGNFETAGVQFTLQESMDGVSPHNEPGPFNSPWIDEAWNAATPGQGFTREWVPGMAYIRLRIANGPEIPVNFSVRGVRY